MHRPLVGLERNESAFNAAAVAMTPNWNTVALIYRSDGD